MITEKSIGEDRNVELEVRDKHNPEKCDLLRFYEDRMIFKDKYPSIDECAKLASDCMVHHNSKMRKLQAKYDKAFAVIEYDVLAIEVHIPGLDVLKFEEDGGFEVRLPPLKHVIRYDIEQNYIAIDGTIQH